ncbi:MAG: acetate--CoA ligase family protein [Acidobacteriota bacterium]|nr:acetate--CoA ligase family protein [Acidobacteriota bacterium]
MSRTPLSRLLAPATIAVVGASEKLGMSNNAVLPMLDAGLEPRLVNPNRSSVYDRPTAPSLTALGEPIDAVLALVNAERSVDVVEEAAALGCGGVVVAAGGFAELGDEGKALQERLTSTARAGGLAVVGPNCSGFMNVPLGVNLFTGGRIRLHPGPIAVVSQSGFLVRACLAAGAGRQLGFSVAVSSGNEAVCGLADYVETFADDPTTDVICLVVEKVREPDRFFAAVSRAQAQGKEILAVKLGRTPAAREIMKSHTGAIADESWVYDVGFREVGVHSARDIDDMLDQAQLLAQLPPSRRMPARRVGVVTSSGGVAAMAADSADDFGIDLPVPEGAVDWLRRTIPGEGTLNPLDMTGFVMRDRDLLEQLFAQLAASEALDAVVLCWWAAEGDEGWSRTLLEPFAEVAAHTDKPMIVSPVEATSIGEWTRDYGSRGVMFCRGIDSTYRALLALDRASTGPAPLRPPAPAPGPSKAPEDLVSTPAGPLVPFATAMELLESAGFAVAPYVLLEPGQVDHAGLNALGPTLVVKLADVPHRTELGAVRVGVTPETLADAVLDLRRIAEFEGVPPTVAVQAMVAGVGEAFVGIQVGTDLGPVVLLGRGGVGVEAAGQVRGRLLPVGEGQELVLADEVSAVRVRGQRDWPVDALASAVKAAERLWAETSGWIASVDINPLVVTEQGLVAVDALLLLPS